MVDGRDRNSWLWPCMPGVLWLESVVRRAQGDRKQEDKFSKLGQRLCCGWYCSVFTHCTEHMKWRLWAGGRAGEREKQMSIGLLLQSLSALPLSALTILLLYSQSLSVLLDLFLFLPFNMTSFPCHSPLTRSSWFKGLVHTPRAVCLSLYLYIRLLTQLNLCQSQHGPFHDIVCFHFMKTVTNTVFL